MKELTESEELKEMGNTVITEEKLDLQKVKIGYVLVTPNISKTVAGRCIKASKELKLYSDMDYIIEISDEIFNSLDEEQRKLLMLHELLHVLVVQDKDGNDVFKLRPHDVEDFSKLIKKYGTEWISVIKTSISSLYDLEPSQYDSIKI